MYDVKKPPVVLEHLYTEDVQSALSEMLAWAKHEGQLDDLVDFEELWKQHQVVKQRLREFSRSNPYRDKWVGASGTTIMKDLYTNPDLYDKVHDWSYLYNHCVLKIQNEAVVEGMGSTLNKHAKAERHLDQVNYFRGAFVDYNCPASHDSDSIIIEVVNRLAKNSRWHFNSGRVHGGFSQKKTSALIRVDPGLI